MKGKRLIISFLVLLALLLSACGSPVQTEMSTQHPVEALPSPESSQELMVIETAENLSSIAEEETEMRLRIGETEVSVRWEDNESFIALRELVADGPLTISMSMYGGFEQVGSIGKSLPRNDSQTTTQAGDIVLYSGNQIVIFYGSNSWSYSRLGKIIDRSATELAELLGNGNIEITLSPS